MRENVKKMLVISGLKTSEDFLKGMKYQKPEIKREKGMTFSFDWIKKMSKEAQIACRQCSSCHGCR